MILENPSTDEIERRDQSDGPMKQQICWIKYILGYIYIYLVL